MGLHPTPRPIRVRDSAGHEIVYTPVEDLKHGDVVVIGWPTAVARVEVEADRARVTWEGESLPDKWLALGTRMPVDQPINCEKCQDAIEPSEAREFRHGAIWCGACCNEEDTGDVHADG